MIEYANELQPIYTKVPEGNGATNRYMIQCDEGWRTSIVCEGMYGWAADWLLDVLYRRPFAPEAGYPR